MMTELPNALAAFRPLELGQSDEIYAESAA